MLAMPDLGKFGRSEQLHAALFGIIGFLKEEGRYPALGDEDKCLEFASN